MQDFASYQSDMPQHFMACIQMETVNGNMNKTEMHQKEFSVGGPLTQAVSSSQTAGKKTQTGLTLIKNLEQLGDGREQHRLGYVSHWQELYLLYSTCLS